jgi:ATP-dependent Lon protease
MATVFVRSTAMSTANPSLPANPISGVTPPVVPVLALRGSVLFPFQMMPLSAGRPNSVAAIQAALESEDKTLVIVCQKNAEVDNPTLDDMYPIGTLAVIKRMSRVGDMIRAIVQGGPRVRLVRAMQVEPYIKAELEILEDPTDSDTEVEARYAEVVQLAQRAFELIHPEAEMPLKALMQNIEKPVHYVYVLGAIFSLGTEVEQRLLSAITAGEAMRIMHDFLTHEVQVLELRHKIASEAATEMSKQQREYMLRQQLQAIRRELGEENPEEAEAAELRRRMEEAQLPDAVRKEVEKELTRLERMSPAAPDFQIARTYIDLALELPWSRATEDRIDLVHARNVLDEDHFDLQDVKDRIIEHLAVMKMNPQAKAPILCFVGPPGVGKTSVGKSIARAMGRTFERMSLGGLYDEAELRGHRRTYIGAMPGRIIQAIRRAGVRNPLLMLDEVDKLGQDFRGDPASALMEILDPEQNREFHDNYLDLPFDLSKVFFITTANTLDHIPRPLLDRMEVLRLAGYSDEEKLQIARRYLLPRQLTEAGLTAEQLRFPDDTISKIIRLYTREAGVRELERAIGRVARKVTTRFAEGHTESIVARPEQLAEWLGPERFLPEKIRQTLQPGIAAGLAWTEAGGDVLYVEAVLLPDGHGLMMTGQLGDVMRESAKAARSYILSQAPTLGLDSERIRTSRVHIHVPAGAVPKDGPSAGVTMAAALASLYTGQPARGDTAMTGEITLSGWVLPVGGIKEKVLAAHRAGLGRVILPRENEKDLRDLPDAVRNTMEFVFVERIEEVLSAAIPKLPLPKVIANSKVSQPV